MDFERKFYGEPKGDWEEIENWDDDGIDSYFTVAGTSHHFKECGLALKNLPFEMRFERDLYNRTDPNAIKIMYNDLQLGWVHKEDAADWANDPDFARMKPVLRRVWRGILDDGTEAISIRYAVFKEKTPRDMRISCPKCGKHYVVDIADAATEVECVKCGEHFVAMDQATKRCPMCGEEILAVAKKCKHCGEYLDNRNISAPQPVAQRQPGATSQLLHTLENVLEDKVARSNAIPKNKPVREPATVSPTAKNRAIYILLALFFGLLGIHDIYAGFWIRAVLKAVMTLTGFLLPISLLWVIFDIFVVHVDADRVPMK